MLSKVYKEITAFKNVVYLFIAGEKSQTLVIWATGTHEKTHRIVTTSWETAAAGWGLLWLNLRL